MKFGLEEAQGEGVGGRASLREEPRLAPEGKVITVESPTSSPDFSCRE